MPTYGCSYVEYGLELVLGFRFRFKFRFGLGLGLTGYHLGLPCGIGMADALALTTYVAGYSGSISTSGVMKLVLLDTFDSF